MNSYQCKCIECGTQFVSGRSDTMYCSTSCKLAKYKKPLTVYTTRSCKWCKNEFSSNKINKCYCSKECQKNFNKSNQRERATRYMDRQRYLGEDRKTSGDLARKLKYLDVDEFCHQFIVHYWQRSEPYERQRIEALNPDIRFA